jgi:phosphoesterase RecJ-like protein
MQNNTALEILEKIKSSKNILINMDTRTDFDALCSSTVLNKYIHEVLGIKTTVIHANKIMERFQKFFAVDNIKTNTDISSLDLTEYDLIIFSDSGMKGHISVNNEFELPDNIETINIDHHETNELFGIYNYVYHYGSCCSVIYEFFKELNIELPTEYLKILAIGIVTDTGSFKYDSCTDKDFRIAAEFVERGVQIWEINSKLTSYEYIDQLRFKGLIYNNLKLNEQKKYAYSTLTLQELKDYKIDMEKVNVRHSDLIKYIEGINVSFVIAEVESNPKYFELSFRSKDPKFDVAELAAKFGGGGHTTAAGAKLYNVNSMEEALNTVKTTLGL